MAWTYQIVSPEDATLISQNNFEANGIKCSHHQGKTKYLNKIFNYLFLAVRFEGLIKYLSLTFLSTDVKPLLILNEKLRHFP